MDRRGPIAQVAVAGTAIATGIALFAILDALFDLDLQPGKIATSVVVSLVSYASLRTYARRRDG